MTTELTFLAKAKPTSAAKPAVSKIEIDDQLSADPLRELCNLGKGLLAFGVLLNTCLRLLVGRLVGELHNDEPVSDIPPSVLNRADEAIGRTTHR